jgi:hypothetical protein
VDGIDDVSDGDTILVLHLDFVGHPTHLDVRLGDRRLTSKSRVEDGVLGYVGCAG